MNNGMVEGTATLLTNGKVLLAVGVNQDADGAALYDPLTETFAATGSMVTPRGISTAILLPSGRVLFAGWGTPGWSGETRNSELYEPSTGVFTGTGYLHEFRYYPTTTLLPDGKVIIVGGTADGRAELYDPQ